MQVDEQFQRLVQGRDDAIDLAEGALLIAAEENSQLDLTKYRQKLAALGDTLKGRLQCDLQPSDSIMARWPLPTS